MTQAANRYPVAYLRRSVADESDPGEVSREGQLAAVHDLAARDAVALDDAHVFTDWGRSGGEAKESRRTEYARLLAAVERGECTVIYAYSLDRLTRSTATFARLLRASRERGVRIVTQREGDLSDTGNPSAWGFSMMTSVFAELELRTTTARNRAATKARRDRGDRLGAPRYGMRIARDASGRALRPIRWEDDPDRPLGPILAAYREAGSVAGAVPLLNRAGVPTARGKGLWHPSALEGILDREGLLPAHGRRRAYSHDALLAGLLRCGSPGCGRTLTPLIAHYRNGSHAYFCQRSKLIGREIHGPYMVPEGHLLPLIKAEAARLQVPCDALDTPGPIAVVFDLIERKRRLGIAYADGLLDEPAYRDKLAKITAEEASQQAAAELVTIPPLDWSQPVAVVNAVLRAMFEYVQLAPDMGIAEIRWRVPQWRAD